MENIFKKKESFLALVFPKLLIPKEVVCLKQKTFSGFFIAFLKSTWNGEHFQKKGEFSSLSISEIIDSKRSGYFSAWEALLQNSFR